MSKITLKNIKIAIVGLGYVGLPLAVAFGETKLSPVIGFDIDQNKIKRLRKGIDLANDISLLRLKKSKIEYTSNPRCLKRANFIITTIPTPVDKSKRPFLKPLKKASKIIGENLRQGAVVVFESTVYPGVTEELCLPIIEKYSGLKAGLDFKIAYSPERINPGDRKHTLEKITKVVSAFDKETLKIVSKVYSLVCKGGLCQASSIRVAEAAKVIENIQRDLNIALVNELALIFHRLGLNTYEVLDVANTKWNFHKYVPGIPSGHCIPVDPYYLTYLAQKIGYHPQVILAGRRINDYMAEYVAELMIKGLVEAGKSVKKSNVLIIGATLKENVSDIRNSKVKDIIRKLEEYQANIFIHDPLISLQAAKIFKAEFIPHLKNLSTKMDGIIFCVPHDAFRKITLADLKKIMNDKPVLVDVKSRFREAIKNEKDMIFKCL